MVSGVIGLQMIQITPHLIVVQVKTMQLQNLKEILSGMILTIVIQEMMAM